MSDAKHISELDPTRRALVDQGIRDVLLLIVAGQGGKPVRIPIDKAAEISETHRLVMEIDREAGYITLQAEKAETDLIGTLTTLQ